MNFLDRLFTFFQNKTLNALGVERDLMELIKAKDISQAMSLMETMTRKQCRQYTSTIRNFTP